MAKLLGPPFRFECATLLRRCAGRRKCGNGSREQEDNPTLLQNPVREGDHNPCDLFVPFYSA
ncbi:MAG: hypothetical protein ABI557_06435 [Aureliella sp.]